jgi:WD40 repeat protein
MRSRISFELAGQHAISCSDDATARVYSLDDGQLVGTMVGHKEGHGINAVCTSPDGMWCITGANDKEIKVWRLLTQEVDRTLRGHEASVLGVCSSPDGQFIASCSIDKTARVWDLKSGKLLHTFTGHQSYISSIAVTVNDTACALCAAAVAQAQPKPIDTCLMPVTHACVHLVDGSHRAGHRVRGHRRI